MSPRTGSLTTEKSSVGLPVEILETDANSSSTRLIRVRSLADACQSTWLLSAAMMVCSAQAGCALRRTAMPIRAQPVPRLRCQFPRDSNWLPAAALPRTSTETLDPPQWKHDGKGDN